MTPRLAEDLTVFRAVPISQAEYYSPDILFSLEIV